ncbi:MAG: Holliday junction resolvase RecU [Streptococcaceae bacterium]|nr:Holliday junction resolvase RecU [Streptococcaceae bacterium]
MIQYPNGKKLISSSLRTKASTNFANRGMDFEGAINDSNAYYLSRKIAVIHKKPTPIQVVKVEYPKRSMAKITEAYYRQASTTDYSGVYRGFYIDFEAKETKQKKSFPLKNFHQHQIEHMKAVLEQKGICFVLLYFATDNRCFLLEAVHLISFFNGQISERKSIPLSYIEEFGFQIQPQLKPRLPFLAIIDQLIEGGKAYR